MNTTMSTRRQYVKKREMEGHTFFPDSSTPEESIAENLGEFIIQLDSSRPVIQPQKQFSQRIQRVHLPESVSHSERKEGEDELESSSQVPIPSTRCSRKRTKQTHSQRSRHWQSTTSCCRIYVFESMQFERSERGTNWM